jgi:hypothetical protein
MQNSHRDPGKGQHVDRRRPGTQKRASRGFDGSPGRIDIIDQEHAGVGDSVALCVRDAEGTANILVALSGIQARPAGASV